jgi:membrane protein YqaA with SNARE-associated domain
MVMTDLSGHAGLFLTALGEGTMLPMRSEIVLVALLLAGGYEWGALVLIAGLGNTLGSALNWFVGRSVERFRDRRWFPVRPEALERAQARYSRYGRWSLLLSWLPVIGDGLTVGAGIMREPLGPFLLLVGAVKTARYVAVVAITEGWFRT